MLSLHNAFKKTFSCAQILEKCCPVSLLTHLLHSAKLLVKSVHTPSVSDDLMCHNNIHNRDKGMNTLIMFFMSLLLVCQTEPVQADRQVTVSSSDCVTHVRPSVVGTALGLQVKALVPQNLFLET